MQNAASEHAIKQAGGISHQPVVGLYAVTPDLADSGELVEKVRAALAAGANLLQYRNKFADAQLRREQAVALKAACGEFGVPLIVNDDIALAAEIDAAGVHLGQDDLALAQARRYLGRAKIIGASCYNRLDLARRAVAASADYVAFGSFYASAVKPGAVPAPLDLLRRAKNELSVPIVAIGGITAHNARVLVDAGADAVAVISALFAAQDVAAAAREFSKLFGRE